MTDVFIIVGLGNPGRRYSKTRHNVGFDTIDFLSLKYNIKVNKVRHKALTGEGEINGCRVILAKPQTFMNLSGECISEIVRWYKIELERLIVIYDDIDIPLGSIRIRTEGSAGTHNGMRSVIYLLNADTFPRIRIGIGMPEGSDDLINYVTDEFGAEQRKIVNQSIANAADAISIIISEGINKAMNKYN